jgi:hypothetical protein
MGGPFASVLAAIPWSTILKQSPALLAAADALIGKTHRKPATPTVAADLDTLRHRVAELEAEQQAYANLVKQLADHVTAIAAAAEAGSARVRQSLILGAAGVGLGLIACLLALFR